jgi:hypothetical protein
MSAVLIRYRQRRSSPDDRSVSGETTSSVSETWTATGCKGHGAAWPGHDEVRRGMRADVVGAEQVVRSRVAELAGWMRGCWSDGGRASSSVCLCVWTCNQRVFQGVRCTRSWAGTSCRFFFFRLLLLRRFSSSGGLAGAMEIVGPGVGGATQETKGETGTAGQGECGKGSRLCDRVEQIRGEDEDED